MPRVDFKLWDRVYILKLICTVQMTFSSFITILYLYLMVLQEWASVTDSRPNISVYKCCIVGMTMFDFSLGTLLAVAANMNGIRCRRRIVIWIISETILIPTSIFLLMRLLHKIKASKTSLQTDIHFTRISIVQSCFLVCHYFFIVYAVDFMVSQRPKIKQYDPSVRPESVHEPTDPKITTTESRHIRMCHSFLFQPNTRKNADVANDERGASTSGQKTLISIL